MEISHHIIGQTTHPLALRCFLLTLVLFGTLERKTMPPKKAEEKPVQLHPLVSATRKKDIWNAVLALRVVNAILLCTFFQPDEFYQAQEPAWRLAFGRGTHLWEQGAYNGPWITWVSITLTIQSS